MTTAPCILQILPELNSGGVERGTLDMARAIVEAEGKAIVVSAGGRQVDALKKMGATHITLPVNTKNPLAIRRNAVKLEQIIQEYNVHLVHARSRAPAWSALKACEKLNIPFVTTFHGVYGLKGFGKKNYNSVMTKGQRIIAVSEYIAEHIIRHYEVPPERIRVIHRGVDLQKFHPDAVHSQKIGELIHEWHLQEVSVPVLLMPGRFTRWKGQHIVLQALARLPHRDFICIFVGDANKHPNYYKELQQWVNKLGLERQVRFAAATNHMAEAYSLSDCVLCPSLEPEAFGRIAVEAQAMGRMVISTNHGGARETVLPGDTGWLVEPGNIDALAAAIHEALNLPEEQRMLLACNAMFHVKQSFSLTRMQDKTLDVYEEVLREAARK